jgi:hypothetical protein
MRMHMTDPTSLQSCICAPVCFFSDIPPIRVTNCPQFRINGASRDCGRLLPISRRVIPSLRFIGKEKALFLNAHPDGFREFLNN